VSQISRDEVAHLARLARLALTDDELDSYAGQLGAILGTEPGTGLVDLVFDRSGGNAYLVEELAGVVRGGGDPADRRRRVAREARPDEATATVRPGRVGAERRTRRGARRGEGAGRGGARGAGAPAQAQS